MIGKLIINKRVNVEVMKNVLSTIWKLISRMSITEIGSRLFIFQFEDNEEKERVLLRQPWSFSKSLPVMEILNDQPKPEEVNWQWCPFWVQIHGLPLGLMTRKIGIVLGESIGDVKEIDIEGEQMAWGRYLRVRVVKDITKPLKRGSKLAVVGQGSVIAVFKYERLPDFCYICGCLDHQELDCDDAVRMTIADGKVKREYGLWLRTK